MRSRMQVLWFGGHAAGRRHCARTVALATLLACALAACSVLPKDTPASDEQRVIAQLAQYEDAIRKFDATRAAALFDEAGELVNPGVPPVHGRAAIRVFLEPYASYKVISNSVKAESTSVAGSLATQVGTYAQSVAGPDGKIFEVKGRFRATWARQPDDRWLLMRMQTTTSK